MILFLAIFVWLGTATWAMQHSLHAGIAIFAVGLFSVPRLLRWIKEGSR
jgi:hypothetical protein